MSRWPANLSLPQETQRVVAVAPDAILHLDCLDRLQGLSDAELAELAGVVDEQVETNIGMAMIYAIISAVQEWLQQKVCK